MVGAEAIRTRIDQLQSSARREIRAFVRPPLVTPAPSDDVERTLASRSVRHRVVYEQPLLDAPSVIPVIRQALERGEHFRLAPRLPVKLLVIDDRVAVVGDPYTPPGAEPCVLVTHHPLLVELCVALFERLWDDAAPEQPSDDEGAPADPEDRLLLSLLLAGLTDQAVAVRSGLGQRTVQRRVSQLMQAARVDSWIQLGWQAARRGWL
ncbi:TrmB family transcriptional regulator [Peterkaempfera sp. SMS 1(5)a]|uniref:TrmB family transcriptional regulator n=1 Tax=Peterkaempfera podocarpi TaxID=3232308 RepID=UPI0036729A5A